MWKNAILIFIIQLVFVLVCANLSIISSLWSAVFISAVLCGASVFYYPNIKSAVFERVIFLAAPFYISYALYWFPVYLSLNSNNAEFSAWALVVIIPCCIVGMISSTIVSFFIRNTKSK